MTKQDKPSINDAHILLSLGQLLEIGKFNVNAMESKVLNTCHECVVSAYQNHPDTIKAMKEAEKKAKEEAVEPEVVS